MKVIISESRLNKLIKSFIKSRLGRFNPPDKRGHPQFMGAFYPQGERLPIAYLKRTYTFGDTLLVNEEFLWEIIHMFSTEIQDIKPILIESVLELIEEQGFSDENDINIVKVEPDR